MELPTDYILLSTSYFLRCTRTRSTLSSSPQYSHPPLLSFPLLCDVVFTLVWCDRHFIPPPSLPLDPLIPPVFPSSRCFCHFSINLWITYILIFDCFGLCISAVWWRWEEEWPPAAQRQRKSSFLTFNTNLTFNLWQYCAGEIHPEQRELDSTGLPWVFFWRGCYILTKRFMNYLYSYQQQKHLLNQPDSVT